MSILKQYANLKVQAKEIEAKLKELEPKVFDQVMAVDGEKIEAKYGTFSLTTKKVWNYSETLLEKESQIKEKIKLMKREEELSGKATLEDIRSGLRFQANK